MMAFNSKNSNCTTQEDDALISKVTNLLLSNSSDGSPAVSDSTPPQLRRPNIAKKNESQSSLIASDENSSASECAKPKLFNQKLENVSVLLQKDAASPLYSAKSFEELNLKPEILKGVYTIGFNRPSRIQEVALPILLADPPSNLIAQSQSGTGKTAAFVLAMLSRVDSEKKYPQILCLEPTYELALQVAEVAIKMAQFCSDIKIKCAVKGEMLQKGSKLSEQVIIGTPGKALDWSLKYKFFDLTKILVFVLDEADVMIDIQGHQDQCIRMQKLLSPQCQKMLFSATYSNEVMDFAEIIIKNAKIIRLFKEEESLDNIKQYYFRCKNKDDKYTAISNIYSLITVGQAIIFCKTKVTANWLSQKMTNDGHSVAILTGDMTVEERAAMLDRFREGFKRVLISTNVLARGIDVEQVTLVVNYDLPVDLKDEPDYETYLHRIGRTGRFGKPGIAINLVHSDDSFKALIAIEKHFKRKIQLLSIDDVEAIELIGK